MDGCWLPINFRVWPKLDELHFILMSLAATQGIMNSFLISSTIQEGGALSPEDWSTNDERDMRILLFHPLVNRIIQSDRSWLSYLPGVQERNLDLDI